MDDPKNTFPTLRHFINDSRRLLRKQQEAEMEAFQDMTSNKSAAEIEDEGAGLTNMAVLNSKDGFYGKTVLTLAKSYYSEKNPVQLPEHCKLGVGDDVALYSGNTMMAEGIIYRRAPSKIKVSIRTDPERDIDFEGLSFNIIMKWNQVTYRRYFKILDTLENPNFDFPLIDVFFKESAGGYVAKKPEPYMNKKLNHLQNQAISHGLIQKCHLIHGPPGTGKTTTICELIVEAVARGQKVLACAPSNIAVDNIVEGISSRVNCVRVGNPARVLNSIFERCLDFLISCKDGQWKSEEKKLNAAQKKLKRCQTKSERKELKGEIKNIRMELQSLQQQIIEETLTDADVICATNAGAGDQVFRKYLEKRMFDLVVIDECGQGVEVSCWIPMIRGKRVVLAGDHKQLPPTVKFQTDSLLSYTLFSRSMEELSHIGSTMLEVQYRMNKIIMGWSNKEFYNNRLVAHESVESHTIQQIYNGVDEEESVILMIDSAGCQMGEEGEKMQSKFNQGEADIVVSVYQKLIKYGIQSKNMAILTPYSKQVTLIKNLMLNTSPDMPEISTVDGIQGREKECILISLVRSNPKREIGFLKDWRRMNVAVTRARRMLILIGDSDCVNSDERIANLIEWIGKHGTIQSAEEFRYDDNVRFGLGKIIDYSEKPATEASAKTEKKEKKNKSKKIKDKEKEKERDKQTENHQKVSKIHTEAEQENSRDLYRKKLMKLSGVEIFYDANAYERKIIHQVAQEFGYSHVTSEDKKKITVSVKKQEQPIQEEEKQEQQMSEKKESRKKKKQKKNKQEETNEKVEVKEKVPENIKDLIGEQSSESQERVENQKKEEKQNKKEREIKENQRNKKKKKKEEKEQKEEDWEKLLDEFTADMPKKDQCFKCGKKITSVTSTQCKYCKLFFCRHDLLAEEHGCEEDARDYARKGGNIDRFLEQGSRKIQEKLKEQQEKRKRKPKGDEKKKK